MGNWNEAVRARNERQAKDGYSSWPAPVDYECVKCQAPRMVTFTTIYGKTTAACDCCGLSYDVQP